VTLKDALDAFIKAFADLEKAARYDDKTPLQNALALSEAKDLFAITDDSPNVFIFADINDFKFVNGEYGYAAGDAAISSVGILIQELFVENYNAQAFRQSGDEFVILLQDKFLDNFRETANSFKACLVQGSEKSFSVGISFGYAVSDGELGFETMRTRAETACKEAKKQGDGICAEWTEEIERTAIQSFRKNCADCGAVTSCYVPQAMKLNSIQFCAVCGKKIS
jgi:diguanylate cyclase (GGDEF)-like protein